MGTKSRYDHLRRKYLEKEIELARASYQVLGFKVHSICSIVDGCYYSRNQACKSVLNDKYSKRFNFVRITANLRPLSRPLVKDGCKSFMCYKGKDRDILNVLQSVLNFTSIVRLRRTAGVRLANGSWTGKIG